MSLRVAPRSPPLRSFVQQISITGTDLPEGRERAVPTADITLMVNLAQDEFRTYEDEDGDATTRTGGAILQGPLTRPTIIDSAELRSLVTVAFSRYGRVVA